MREEVAESVLGWSGSLDPRCPVQKIDLQEVQTCPDVSFVKLSRRWREVAGVGLILQDRIQERAQEVLNLLAIVVVGDEINCFATENGEGVCGFVDAFALEDEKELHDLGSSALKLFASFQTSFIGDSTLPKAIGRTILAIHVDRESEARPEGQIQKRIDELFPEAYRGITVWCSVGGFGSGWIGRKMWVEVGGRELVFRSPEEVLLPGAQAVALVDEGKDPGKDPHAVQGVADESNRIFVEEVVLGVAQVDQTSRDGQDKGFEVGEGLWIVAHGTKVRGGDGLEDMFGGFWTLPELGRQRVSRPSNRASEECKLVTVCQKSVKVEGMAT
jgi:hypothetical protein